MKLHIPRQRIFVAIDGKKFVNINDVAYSADCSKAMVALELKRCGFRKLPVAGKYVRDL